MSRGYARFDHALGRGPMPLDHDLFYEMAPADPPNWPRICGTWRKALPGAHAPLPIALPREPVELTFDPDAPFPTLGGGVTSGGTLMAGGMFDHRAAEDDLTACGVMISGDGPLTRPFTLAGRVRLSFDLGAVTPPGPFDVSAVLMLRMQDGALVNVTDGFVRLQAGAVRGHLDMLASFLTVPPGAEPVILWRRRISRGSISRERSPIALRCASRKSRSTEPRLLRRVDPVQPQGVEPRRFAGVGVEAFGILGHQQRIENRLLRRLDCCFEQRRHGGVGQ